MSFPPTRLSVVARIRSEDAETRRVALAALVEAYWKPIYKYLRLKWHLSRTRPPTRRRSSSYDARERPGRPLRSRARPLPHLPAAVPRRLRGERAESGAAAQARRRRHHRAARLHDRGGRDATHEPSVAADVDELFYREWVRALFDRAVGRPARACRERGPAGDVRGVRALRSERRRERARPTTRSARPSALTAATVTNHLAAMRRQFRAIVLDRLRELTGSDDEWEAEAQRSAACAMRLERNA